MFMRFMSDLHLEFHGLKDPVFEIPVLDTDADTVLVLAGDIARADRPRGYKDFITKCAKQFHHVIWIMGNHEHWGGSVFRSIAKIKREIGELDNVSLIENETVRLGNTDFICSTLWTDFANGNPLAEMKAHGVMRDYKKIRTHLNPEGSGGNPYARKLHPSDTIVWHRIAVNFITKAIEDAKQAGQQTVVVTHHAPSHQSLMDHFRGDPLNVAYATPLDGMIMDTKPDYWIHGHIHQTQDYNIEHTNVLANPRGYFDDMLNHEFDPEWTIDLS